MVASENKRLMQTILSEPTKSGSPYNNTYCWVCRIADGKLRELTEYLDTELITTALAPPGAPSD